MKPCSGWLGAHLGRIRYTAPSVDKCIVEIRFRQINERTLPVHDDVVKERIMTEGTDWPLRCAGNDAVSSAYVYNETHVRAIPELLSRNLREYLLHSARAREHRKVLRLEDEIIFAVVQLVGVEHLVPRVVCCRDPSLTQ